MDVPLNLQWLQPGHIVFSSDDSSKVDLHRFQQLKITLIHGSHSEWRLHPIKRNGFLPNKNWRSLN
jgi:hypothetical protein